MLTFDLDIELREKLIAIIRSAMDLELTSLQLFDSDIDELMYIGKQQSILSLLYYGLKKYAISADVLENFNKARFEDIRQYVVQSDSLNKICNELEKCNIPYIVLKGAYIRQLYPKPELRTCLDIDILVHEKDIDNAIKAIEVATDLKFCKRNYHDISMFSPNVHFELHFSIKENMKNIDVLLKQVWDYAFPTEGFRYYMTPEYQIFHVVAHMSYHMVHGGLGIRPFLDLWLLRNKTVFDASLVKTMCSDCGILLFYQKCCDLVDSWMMCKPVPVDLKTLENYIFSGGVFGNSENNLASRQRNNRGAKYILHRIFLNRDLLEVKYPKLKTTPFLYPYFQMKRWFSIFKPSKKAQISAELKLINSVDNSTIDSYDNLLKSLGL